MDGMRPRRGDLGAPKTIPDPANELRTELAGTVCEATSAKPSGLRLTQLKFTSLSSQLLNNLTSEMMLRNSMKDDGDDCVFLCANLSASSGEEQTLIHMDRPNRAKLSAQLDWTQYT